MGQAQRPLTAAPQSICVAVLLTLVEYSISTEDTADASVTFPVTLNAPRLTTAWLSGKIWLGGAVSIATAAFNHSTVRA